MSSAEGYCPYRPSIAAWHVWFYQFRQGDKYVYCSQLLRLYLAVTTLVEGYTLEAIEQTYYSLTQGQLYATRRGEVSASNGQSCIDLIRRDLPTDIVSNDF